MIKAVGLGCLALMACGDDGNTGTADASIAPPVVTISGTVTARSTSSMNLEGVTVVAIDSTTEEVVAMATSDANGYYSLMFETGGVARRGYLKGTFTGYLDTYLYPPGLIDKDFASAHVNMLTADTLDLLANTFCMANQLETNGVVAVVVADTATDPIGGAVVSSSPPASRVCYNEGGFPNRMATATDTDGVAYLFNVTGQGTVSAMSPDLTFRSTVLNARPGTFTTALVTP